MKVSFKLASVAMLLAAGFSGSSMAHDIQATLPTSGLGIDVYHTSCFSWQTKAAADAASVINGDTEILGPAGRFVGRVAKRCTTNNATCSPVAGTVTINIGPEANNPASTALIGASASTSSGNGTGSNIATPTYATNWVATPSAYVQTANAGPYAAGHGDLATTGKNGAYTVVISHSGSARGYWAQFHCESLAVNALPAPGSPASDPYHTGTGVTLTGHNAPDSTTGFNATDTQGTTGGDFNYTINQ